MIPLRAPQFWNKPSLLGSLLSPLGLLYGAFAALRATRIVPVRATVPVIAVGNITLGGAGKTPISIALARMLQTHGHTPHILSRGYGSEPLSVPLLVDTSLHSALMTGDEPLLLARVAPTWVFPARAESAPRAVAAGASLLLLDDGLQHHGFHKDLSFLVIDTDYGLGNGEILPAGPLRESLDSALDRTHAIVALGQAPLRVQLPQIKPVFRAALVPTADWSKLASKTAIAFAGLARPEKFFKMCEKSGLNLLERHPFPDHHPFSRIELDRLIDRASMLGATLVCTEKDAVKLHPDDRARVTALGVDVMWQDEVALTEFLTDRLGK